VRKAATSGLARSFRRSVRIAPERLSALMRQSGRRRAQVLLAAASHDGRLAVGVAQARAAWVRGRAVLLVVACDAGATAREPWLAAAIGGGSAVAWGSARTLGLALGRSETVGVIAVLDDALSRALSRAVRVAQTPAAEMGSRKVGDDASTEVR
jgi:ribosomal protein L30E